MDKRIIIPLFSKDSGLGHLIRSFRLCKSLSNSEIYIHEDKREAVQKILHTIPKNNKRNKIKIVSELTSSYQAIILDTQRVTLNELRNWKQFGLCIGIDIGGEGREYFDYLIDTIPNNFQIKANFYQLGLSIPSDIVTSIQNNRTVRKVLYYPNAQQIQHLEKINDVFKSRYIELTCIVFNEDLEKKIDELNIKKISCNIDVYKELHRYDLLLSHYGLSVFEALRARIPVVLFNPSKYHQELSSHFGFPQAFQDIAELIYYLSHLDVHAYTQLLRQCQDIQIKSNPSLDSLLEFLLESRLRVNSYYCTNPSLGLNIDRVVYRTLNRSIYQCKVLKQWYQHSYFEDMPSYDQSYFGIEYKKQYGKTYLEDLSNIEKRMRKRMNCIDSLLKITSRNKSSHIKKTILDLGSSYGAMLNVVPKEAYIPIGIDISKEAVEYSKEQNHISYTLNLEDTKLEKKIRALLKNHAIQEVHVISVWFVIEHFPNIQNILKTIHALLPKGGILALSVPNAGGITAIRDFQKFCSISPCDHYSLFTVSALKNLLKNWGFTISKIRSTGFHPSRFPLGYLLYSFWYLLSKIFILGDTFEIYAIKR